MRKIVKKGMALASATIMIAGSMPMTAVNISASENHGKQIAVQSEQSTEIQAEEDIAVQSDSEIASGTWENVNGHIIMEHLLLVEVLALVLEMIILPDPGIIMSAILKKL